MSQRKVTDLKDMIIKEISLVIDPASPGADILFTKAHDVSDEPRDRHGRWTTATAAAREHAKVLSGHAKRMAVKAFNSVKGSSVAITSTRPHGAKPVHGGGVQFEFRHTLGDGTRYISSVQIRPEHLDRVAGAPQEGQHPSRLHRTLAAIHTALNRAGVALVRPFGAPPNPGEKGFGGFLRVNHMPLSAAEQEEKNFQDRLAQVRLNRRRDEELRAASGTGAPAWVPRVISNQAPAASSAAASAMPSSPAPQQGIKGTSHGGIPTYQPPALPPDWVKGQRLPEGHGVKEDVMGTNVAVPLAATGGHASARTAAGWPYYTHEGDFIPGGRPDVQEHMEGVAHWRRTDPRAPQTIASMISSHQKVARDANGVGHPYFTAEGDYVPAGSADNQRRYESRYEGEHYRLAKDLAPDPDEERLAAVREPAIQTPPHRLFDNGHGQQVTEDIVRRMPEDPALASAREGSGQRQQWEVKKGAGGAQPLNFYAGVAPAEKVRKRQLAYVKSVTKSKLR
ncbi:MAG: hypothetical protein KGL39_03235 [Patescibacteria group bacterium]|nr:hypothetical protein [Patescibacteria group bacterium]